MAIYAIWKSGNIVGARDRVSPIISLNSPCSGRNFKWSYLIWASKTWFDRFAKEGCTLIGKRLNGIQPIWSLSDLYLLEVIFYDKEYNFQLSITRLNMYILYLTAGSLYWSFGTIPWILWIWISHWAYIDSEIWLSKFWALLVASDNLSAISYLLWRPMMDRSNRSGFLNWLKTIKRHI